MRTTTLAAAALTAGLLLTGCGSSTPAKPSPSPTPSNTWPGGLPPVSDNPTPDLATKLIDWADGGGQADLSTISEDLDAVETDLNEEDIDGLIESCAALAADVETAQAGDPPPDKTARHHWEKALEHWGDAASECTLGASSDDPSGLGRMGGELTIGSEHMSKFNDRFDEVAEDIDPGV